MEDAGSGSGFANWKVKVTARPLPPGIKTNDTGLGRSVMMSGEQLGGVTPTVLPPAATPGVETQPLTEAALRCQAYVRTLGYRYFHFSFRLPLQPQQPSIFTLTNYPRGWLDRYRERGYAAVDTVTARLNNAMVPFTWRSEPQGPPLLRDLFEQARAHGLHAGVCVPLYGPRGAQAALTAAGDALPPPGDALERHYAGLLHFGLRQFSDITQRFAAQSAAAEASELTARQQQILTGIAEGLSYYDIGERCGIKASTVKTLLDRCCQKLGVNTREQAIVIAMASGQIHPVTYPAAPGGRVPPPGLLHLRAD